MGPDRWSDDRLDDLAAQVRFVGSLTTQVATHHAQIDGLTDDVAATREQHGKDLGRIEKAIIEIRDECRAQAKANAWTPVVKAAVIGPTMASLIAAVALIVTKGS